MRSRPLLLAGLLLSGCRAGVGPYRNAPVVLISIDTLRADHLPLYGYGKGSTPNLDALGRQGVVFEDVYSHCPLTLPAHASLFTGLLPPHHGVRDNLGFTLAPGHPTLATRFREAGWPTGGAVSAFVLRSATGIAQGFDFYDDALEIDAAEPSLAAQRRDGAGAVDLLGKWIVEQDGRRFFAFLHLYEPHAPYDPPPPYQRFDHPYDGKVAYADELVGRLLITLRSRGVLDRAILAVTSDHGEGLGDHGEQEHGFFLYREAVRVPLILRLPGGAGAGARVSGVAAQVDVPATLLDLAGIAPSGMDGVSLRTAITAGSIAARPVYAETFFPRYHFGWSELLSVTDDRFRYIRAPRPELFDRRADPAERNNLAPQETATLAAMNGWLKTQVEVGDVAARGAVTADVQERLRALGYLGGGSTGVTSGPPADPKDKVAAFELYKRAVDLRREGKDEESAAALKGLLADEPSMADAWEDLGLALVRLGREAEGIAALERAVEGDPRRASAHLSLARIHALAGRRQLAEKHAELASASDPGRGYETLALLMLDKNRLSEAQASARKSLAADRDRVMARFALGVVARRSGRCEEALAAFREAAEAQARQKGLVVRDLHAGMADCLARLGREAEAEAEFKAEILTFPFSREGRVGLAMLYRSQGRDAEARTVLEGVVTKNPRAGANEYWTVVRTLTGLGELPAAREWASRARAMFPADPRFRSSW